MIMYDYDTVQDGYVIYDPEGKKIDPWDLIGLLNGRKIEELRTNWLEKAEWLRSRGYGLNIYSLDGDDGDKWKAETTDNRRRYGPSLENVVSQIYNEIKDA